MLLFICVNWRSCKTHISFDRIHVACILYRATYTHHLSAWLQWFLLLFLSHSHSFVRVCVFCFDVAFFHAFSFHFFSVSVRWLKLWFFVRTCKTHTVSCNLSQLLLHLRTSKNKTKIEIIRALSLSLSRPHSPQYIQRNSQIDRIYLFVFFRLFGWRAQLLLSDRVRYRYICVVCTDIYPYILFECASHSSAQHCCVF